MKLIESKAELIQQPSGLEGVYKQIELCGRTCYKSSPKYRYWTADKKHFINEGTEDFKMLYSPEKYPIKQNVSAHDFVDRMIKSNHTAMLEHGTVYLFIKVCAYDNDSFIHIEEYTRNPYSKVICCGVDDSDESYHDILGNSATGDIQYVITTNLRVLVENGWLDDLKYICEPTEYHEKRYTLKLTTDRGVSHELVRHRVFSFAQESTRYCNYSKDKFGNELTFIIPTWANNLREGSFDDTLKQDAFWHDTNGGEMLKVDDREMCLMGVLNKAESCYMDSIERGLTPQQARQMLPNALKTEICMTGFESDWKHFLDLRYFEVTGKAHPDMKELATKIVEQFKNNNIKIGEI